MTMQSKIDIAEQHGTRQREQELRAETQSRRDEDLRFVMSTETGRRFMWDLLGRTGLYQTSFTGNSETFFREGRRAVGLEQLAHITTACPTEYMAMMKEQHDG